MTKIVKLVLSTALFALPAAAKKPTEQDIEDICRSMAVPKKRNTCELMLNAWQTDIDTLNGLYADHQTCLTDVARLRQDSKGRGK